MNEIKTILAKWSDSGIKFPYAYDGSTGQPSITLLFAYLTFVVALVGNISVYFNPNLLTASINSSVLWVVAFVLYRMRKLDNVKFDLDDRSFELSGESDEKTPN